MVQPGAIFVLSCIFYDYNTVNIVLASSDNIDPEDWLAPLQVALPGHQIHIWQVGQASMRADIAVVWKPPPSLFEQERALRLIFNLGAGVDALFRLPSLPGNVPIVRLEDAGMAVQMAEYAVHALARTARQFDVYESQQRQGLWWPLPALDRTAWPVGVLGMGVMGARVAQTLAMLDYPVAGWARNRKNLTGVGSYAGATEFKEFLSRTRVLINTLPLTDETRHILCKDTLQHLLPDAYIMNMGRGAHLVEEDLLALLDSGCLRGASLDVFSEEPLPKGHPFWNHPRVTMTPHISAMSLRLESIAQVAAKIRGFERGEPLTGVVSRDHGY
jgi:glyoxylate/hydroxypyruvate reductase